MPDFNIRSDSVNVEQIMEQIRARIREKRGVDYTEQQIRELAAVKLEKFLDPRGVRSDLLEQFRRTRESAAEPRNYTFEDTTLYESHRGPVRWIRKLLNPILKLFFNPNPLIEALHLQAQLNAEVARRHQLSYEVMHNVVVELTKLGIETKNVKMRLESLASRLDFNERRARALESVVVYKPASERESIYETPPAAPLPGHQPAAATPAGSGSQTPQPGPGGTPEGPGQRSRRRRRRRGRRGGGSAAAMMGGAPQQAQPENSDRHAAIAESVQQAIASESHPTESGRHTAPAPAPTPPADSRPGGDDPSQQ
jgi:hypothetical protein